MKISPKTVFKCGLKGLKSSGRAAREGARQGVWLVAHRVAEGRGHGLGGCLVLSQRL